MKTWFNSFKRLWVAQDSETGYVEYGDTEEEAIDALNDRMDLYRTNET